MHQMHHTPCSRTNMINVTLGQQPGALVLRVEPLSVPRGCGPCPRCDPACAAGPRGRGPAHTDCTAPGSPACLSAHSLRGFEETLSSTPRDSKLEIRRHQSSDMP